MSGKGLKRAPSLKAMSPKGPKGRSAAIEDLLDAIVKKKTFKQLAGYSIKCLQGLLNPSRIGWEIQARAAFDLGGTRAVLDVLVRYPADAELLRFGLSSLRSMVSVQGTGTIDTETVSATMTLLRGLVEGDGGGMPEADRTALTAEALEYTLAIARKAPAALPGSGLMALLGSMCKRLASTGAGGGAGKSSKAGGAASSAAGGMNFPLITTLFRLLLALSLSREGQTAICGDAAFLADILGVARVVYEQGSLVIAPAASGAGPTTPLSKRSASSAGELLTGTVGLKTVLDPVLRVVDRLSRVPEGFYALQDAHAAAKLLAIADWWVHAVEEGNEDVAGTAGPVSGETSKGSAGSHAAGAAAAAAAAAAGAAASALLPPATVLDLINRLAGDATADLLAVLTAAEIISTPSGKQQSARLLAKLCDLPERSNSLARDRSQVATIVDLLNSSVTALISDEEAEEADEGSAAADISGVFALLQLLCRVAERPATSVATSGLQTVLDAGGLAAALYALDAVATPYSVKADLNVLHAASGASALRLIAYILSAAPDAEVAEFGYPLDEGQTSAGAKGTTAVSVILGHEADDGRKFLQQVAALLQAPIDGLPESSRYLCGLTRLTYALSTANELLLLAAANDAGVIAAGLDLRGSSPPASATDFLTALGTALTHTAKVYCTISGGAGGADRESWSWLPRAASSLGISACAVACSSSAAATALLGSGGLTALMGILSGRSTSTTSIASPAPKKGLTRAASSVAIGGRTVNYLWLRHLLREEPSVFAAVGLALPARLAAQGLYLSASFITYLAPHAPGAEAHADAGVLSAAVVTQIQEAAQSSSHPPPAAAPTPAFVRAAIDAMLEACLLAYASFPTDGDVYAAFKEVVEVAGVSAEELVAAVDGLRGVCFCFRETLSKDKLVQSAVRTSAITVVGATIAGALRTADTLIEGSELYTQEANEKEAVSSAAAAVRNRAPSTAPLVQQLIELCGVARERLLLLEAVSLSPSLSWAMCYINGLYPVLDLLSLLHAVSALHSELDSNAGGAAAAGFTPAKLAERLDDVLSHVFVLLANLARVAYEVRQSRSYALDDDYAGAVRAGLDRRIIPEQLFAGLTSEVVCSVITSLTSTSLRLSQCVVSAVPLLGWLAAAANVNYSAGAAADSARYVSTIVAAGFMECSVALLRQATAMAVENAAKASASSSLGSQGVTYDTIAAIVTNVQHLAIHKAGAQAVATRGVSRQLLRAIPALLNACGGNTRHAAYRALLALLQLLNVCLSMVGESADEGSENALSVKALLLKQGLMDGMLAVAFSEVGLGTTAALGSGDRTEACQAALAIVSATSSKKDVTSAVSLLYELCGKVSASVSTYMDGAQSQVEGWSVLSAQGQGAKAAPAAKMAVLDLDTTAADNADGDAEGRQASALLSAVQLFGLLITTDAGKRAGRDVAAQGLAACASLVQSAVTYLVMAGRVQDSVLGAVAAITAQTDANAPPTPLPGPIASAASTALAVPPKAERDLLWVIPTACQVMRVTQAVLLGQAEAEAASSSDIDPLTQASNASAFLKTSLTSAVDTSLTTVDAAALPVLSRFTAAASGVNLLGTSGGSGGAAKKLGGAAASGGAGAAAAITLPTSTTLVREAMSTLAAFATASVCAAAVPGANEGSGLETLLGAISAQSDTTETSGGAAGGQASGSQGVAVDVACSAMTVISGVAKLGGKALASLRSEGAVAAIMRVLPDIVQAAVAQGQGTAAAAPASRAAGASTAAANFFAVAGLTDALLALDSLAEDEESATDMQSAGLVSFLKSCAVLLPEDGRGEAAGVKGDAAVQLVRAVAQLSHRLASVGWATFGELSSDADLSGETAHSAALRELVVRCAAGVPASTACTDSQATVLSVLKLVVCYAVASDFVPEPSAVRTLAALRASATKLSGVAKKVMTSGTATPQVLQLGRQVISLITPKSESDASASADSPSKTAAAAAAAQVDELDDTISDVYGWVEDLQTALGQYTSSCLEEHGEADVLALVRAEKEMEKVLEGIRSLSLLVVPRYPIGITEDGSAALAEKDVAAARAFADSLEETAATEWSVYATLKQATTALCSWLCSLPSRTFNPSARSVNLALDIISACLPMIGRMTAYAEDNRAAALAEYYDGKRAEWELDAVNDVPLDNALGTVGLVLDSHVNVLSAIVSGKGNQGIAAHYVPTLPAFDALCRCLRLVVSACGHDAVRVSTQLGLTSGLMRLLSLAKETKEKALAGTAFAGEGHALAGAAAGTEAARERGRQIAAETERCSASVSATLRAILTKAESEVSLYCVPSDDGDEPREVGTLIPPMEMAALMRTSAALAVLASEGEEEDEDEDKDGDDENSSGAASKSRERNPGNAALDAQAKALVQGAGGHEAAWLVLDHLSAQTLAAITMGATADASGATDPRANLKVFSSLLTALANDMGADGKGGKQLPGTFAVVRTLYATIATCSQILMGSAFTQAAQASAADVIFRDAAENEHADLSTMDKQDTDVSQWIQPAALQKLASSAVDDAPVEEL